MFGSSKKAPAFPRGEFQDRLDALLAAAEQSGVGSAEIADILEGRAQTWRTRSAVTWTHDSLPTTVAPKVSTIEQLRDALLRRADA
jgi:hypothetical protein